MRFFLSFSAAAGLALLATGASATEDRVLDFPASYKTAFSNYLISDRLNQDDQVISLSPIRPRGTLRAPVRRCRMALCWWARFIKP